MAQNNATKLLVIARFFEELGKAETVLRPEEAGVLQRAVDILKGRPILLSPEMSHSLAVFLDGCAKQVEILDFMTDAVRQVQS